MHWVRAVAMGAIIVGGMACAVWANEPEAVDTWQEASSPARVDALRYELESRIERLEALTREDSAAHGSGLSGGAELIFFKPCGEAGSNTALYVGDVDFLPAWRLWGGASNEEGQGLRVRWWQYDQTISRDRGRVGTQLVFQKLDLEVTQQIAFRRWELLLSGGATYAGNGLQVIVPRYGFTSRERWRFDGAGVTCGAQVIRHSAWFPAWNLVANAQWSGVYGNSAVPGGFFGDRSVSEPGTCASITELSLGPRWERSFDGGAVLFAGAGAEAQYWTTGLGSTPLFFGRLGSFAGDIGLIGLTCNIGLRR